MSLCHTAALSLDLSAYIRANTHKNASLSNFSVSSVIFFGDPKRSTQISTLLDKKRRQRLRA